MKYVLYLQELSPASHPVKSSISEAEEEVFSFWLMAGIKMLDKHYGEGKSFIGRVNGCG